MHVVFFDVTAADQVSLKTQILLRELWMLTWPCRRNVNVWGVLAAFVQGLGGFSARVISVQSGFSLILTLSRNLCHKNVKMLSKKTGCYLKSHYPACQVTYIFFAAAACH